MKTQDVTTLMQEIRDGLGSVRRDIYGNGSGRQGLVERAAKLEVRMESMEEKQDVVAERLGELASALKERVPKIPTLWKVPIYWLALGACLAIIVLLIFFLAGSKGLVDTNSIANKATDAAVEYTTKPDGGS